MGSFLERVRHREESQGLKNLEERKEIPMLENMKVKVAREWIGGTWSRR